MAIGVALGVAIIHRKVVPGDFVDPAAECAAGFAKDPRSAVAICQVAFERNHAPATGIHLARALFANDMRDEASQLATQLLATPALSDALQVLGKLAVVRGKAEDAIRFLRGAHVLHRAQHQAREAALDGGVLAQLLTDRGQFTEALQLLDACITESSQNHDVPHQRFCHLQAARTLIMAGYSAAAHQELELAVPLATSKKDLADLSYQRGNAEQELGNHSMAVAHFEAALRQHEASPNPSWTAITELNLAYSLAELGSIDQAIRYLEQSKLHDIDHQAVADQAWTEAQIAYKLGDLARAASASSKYFELVGADPDDASDPKASDDRTRAATLRARLELERNDLQHAELWAKRAIAQIECVRSTQPVLELRPWILDKRRAPYDLLFTALARNHHIKDAALAFDRSQGRTVQDALATRRSARSPGRREIAAQVGRLGEWLRSTSLARFAAPPDLDAVLRTMRGIDLLALIVANNEVWRLTANHGPPRLDRLGSWNEIKDRVDQFAGHATDARLADELGRLFVPDDAFRNTREVLYVLLDGRRDAFDALPVAALRRGSTALTELRPMVRVLRLPEGRCDRPARPGLATVLADPLGDLPTARDEGEQVAALLHTTSKAGAAATPAALFGAAGDAVLHVAAHGNPGIDGASLALAGGEVSALQIAASGRAPPLVVLSTCNAAESDAVELAGSLVAGFLAAGAQHAIGTLRSVSDAGAIEISTRFYRNGGTADPAHALATAQAELARTDNLDWPYFAVFAPDACSQGTPRAD